MLKHKLLDIFIVLLIVALGVFFFKLVQGNNELASKVHKQEFQAKIFIEEIGDTKEENNVLFRELNELKDSVDDLGNIAKKSNDLVIKSASAEASASATAEAKIKTKVPRIKQPIYSLTSTQNFLIAGQHKQLTDTIMVAAVNPGDKTITLISLPRDLYINGRKINEYYELYGADSFRENVEKITGLQIHKFVIFNFDGFRTVIDGLGGIDIYVSKAINDYAYPDGSGEYTTYSVSAGSHHMDGLEALKYARSRHSTSDFDRAERQQQIMHAVQERVINFNFLNNLDKIGGLYNAISDATETDISIADIVKFVQDYQYFTIESGNVLSTSNLLYSTYNIKGQYILLPKGDDFGVIKKYVGELLAK